MIRTALLASGSISLFFTFCFFVSERKFRLVLGEHVRNTLASFGLICRRIGGEGISILGKYTYRTTF